MVGCHGVCHGFSMVTEVGTDLTWVKYWVEVLCFSNRCDNLSNTEPNGILIFFNHQMVVKGESFFVWIIVSCQLNWIEGKTAVFYL